MYKKIFKWLIVVSIFSSCSEDKWLEEIPKDFYSPENSFTKPADFEAAVVKLYADHRARFVANENSDAWMKIQSYWADNLYTIYPTNQAPHNLILPEEVHVLAFWTWSYRLIYDANVILNRIDNPAITFANAEQKNRLKAEAHLFRAYGYRMLYILYGGVPITTEETNKPKRDYVRATKAETLQQIINDLNFASINLPHVTKVTQDGRLTKAVAFHYLAEAYIMQKEWDKAITAASEVINDPSYALMKQRFGTKKDNPGDVFSDLFIRDNQNRNGKGGLNTEGLWVSQYEYNKPGGGTVFNFTRTFTPQYWVLVGKDGKDLFFGHSSQNGGRSFGWAASNDYVNYTIWQNDPTDMRNSSFNIVRDMVADNPASAYFGKKIVESGAIKTPGPYNEFWRPIWAKYVPFNNFPAEAISNVPYPGATNTLAAGSFTDAYVIRLAETYLLRAEAYIGKSNGQLAADDINVIRLRANAPIVDAAKVDLNYLLDERLRELNYEEQRLLTLMRTNTLIQRAGLYNPYYNGKYASYTMPARVINWPIPQSEIERNTESELKQNDGY